MTISSVIKVLYFNYLKSRLGAIGNNSHISLFADLRANTKDIHIGESVTICKYTTLEVDRSLNIYSKIIVGNNTLISSFVVLRTHGGLIKIGNSCFINSFSILYGHGDLVIGNQVLIGPQVTIVPANYGFQERDAPLRMQSLSKKGIMIEDNVWIGAGVTILDGCTIGQGAVIGAGAVVTKCVEPYTIVAGIPAKPIGCR